MPTKTKGVIVNRALSKLGISGIVAPATPEDMQKALFEMEDMMSEFDSRNICTNFAGEDDPDPATESGIADEFISAASSNLAVRIAPSFGLEAQETTKRQARQSLANWGARTGKTNQINYPFRQPRGSGNTFRFLGWYRYFRIQDNAPVECDTLELRVDERNIFNVDVTGYLRGAETVSSFEQTVAPGLALNSITQADGVFTLDVTGVQAGWHVIRVTFTTSLGRVNPMNLNFNVTSQPT